MLHLGNWLDELARGVEDAETFRIRVALVLFRLVPAPDPRRRLEVAVHTPRMLGEHVLLPQTFIRRGERRERALDRLLTWAGLAGGERHPLHVHGECERDEGLRTPRVRSRALTVAWLRFVMPYEGLAEGVEWLAVRVLLEETPGLLAPETKQILNDALGLTDRLTETTTLAARLCPPRFTLAELRESYEGLWALELDPGNFTRRATSLEGFLAPVGPAASSTPRGGRRAEQFVLEPSDSDLLLEPFRRPVARRSRWSSSLRPDVAPDDVSPDDDATSPRGPTAARIWRARR